MAKLVAFTVLCLSFLVGGCGWAYLIAPDPQKDVEAKFKELPGHTVAVVIYADQNTLFEYDTLRYDMSSAVSAELSDKVEKLKPVSSLRIAKYQSDNVDWETGDRTKLGKALGADYVLYISLDEFSTKEAASSYLYRGRIAADVNLYDCSKPERAASVWKCPGLKISYPDKKEQAKPADERAIYGQTISRLADTLAKNFYKHKELPSE